MDRAWLVSLCLLTASCTTSDDCEECAAPDGGGRHGSSDTGGDRDPCADDSARRVLEWDAESELGSAADAFGAAEGTCEAELTWNAAPFDDRRVDPVMGRTRMTVELALDHDSAGFIERRAREGSLVACGGYLEAGGYVVLESEDGTFRAEGNVTLRRSSASSVLTYELRQELAEHEGSLSIELHDGERGTLQFELDGSGVCAGEVRFSVTSGGNGMASGGIGRLAQWSDSICPLGQAPFDLTAALGDEDRTLPEVIEELWGDATYAGTWRDGSDAELELRVEAAAEVACREVEGPGHVVVPIRATYSTSDGRLQEQTGDATVNATLGDDGSVRQLDFWLSDDLVCATENDTLAYTPADCAEVDSVTVQLGFNYYGTGSPEANDRGLHVYFSPRGGGEPPPGDWLEL